MVALPTAIVVLASTFTATAADAAGAPSPEASDVVVGLLQLSHALGSASSQPALSTDLPLTDVSVRSVLDLDTAIGQHVTDAVTGADADLDSLPSVINADPALHLVATTPTAGAPAASRDWLLSVDLKGAVPVALKYADERLQFGTADLTGKAAGELTGTVRIRYDGSALPLRRFSVVGDSELTTHVWTRPTGSTATTGQQLTADAFPAVDGFMQLLASGTGTIDTTTVLRLRDPNGRGALTTEDFEFGSADEMFTTKTPPAADDVQMHLDLSSDLLSDGAHGSVAVGTRDAASTSPYAAPVVTRDTELDQLTALSRTQALTGFAKYTTALLGAESSVDAELPLLTTKLSDLYSPGNRLLQLLTQQATATITCGAANTSPPTGAPRPGEARYCQATTAGGLTVDDGTSIAWASPDAGVTITGDTAGTVGSAPTANVTVTGGGGFPVLTASFPSDGPRRTARTLIGSIQDLSQAVSDLGLDGGLTYDTDNQSLEVAVRQDDESEKTTSVTTGGNGNLAPLTGLTGLCQAEVGVSPRRCPRTGDAPDGGTLDAPAAGQADVTTSGRQIDATFGIGLVPRAAAPAEGDPAPATPVTYVKPGANGLLWRVGSVTAAMTSDAAVLPRGGLPPG